MVWARAGCNLSWGSVCGNYLLHGSAVGNCYLYPGCQTIGFPPLTLCDIRWSSMVCVSRSVSIVVHIKCVCAYSHLDVLLANKRKGQECHFRSTWLSVVGGRTCCWRRQSQRERGQVMAGHPDCESNSVLRINMWRCCPQYKKQSKSTSPCLHPSISTHSDSHITSKSCVTGLEKQ